MKLVINIAQQQTREQAKGEKTGTVQEEKEDTVDPQIRRIESLERGRRRGGYRGGFNSKRGQYQNQNNRQIKSRD